MLDIGLEVAQKKEASTRFRAVLVLTMLDIGLEEQDFQGQSEKRGVLVLTMLDIGLEVKIKSTAYGPE